MTVQALRHGDELDQPLVVREIERRARRDGGEFVRLVLGDRTGTVVALVWDDVARTMELCHPGLPVHVTGTYEVDAGGTAQLVIRALRPPAAAAAQQPGPPRAPEQMEADLRELVATVRQPDLRRLLDVVFGEGSETWARYRAHPAAKLYHQAYAHGLLEHSLTVAQAVSATSAIFPGIDRDLAVAGALLHDIGKLDAYTPASGAIDLTDVGRLQGEIPLGYYRVRRTIDDLPGFPEDLAQALLHIILAHHGALAHGSPVVPCTREATLVHMMDNLGGRLGSFDRLERDLAPGASWSAFDRALGAGAWFGPIRAEDRRAEAA